MDKVAAATVEQNIVLTLRTSSSLTELLSVLFTKPGMITEFLLWFS